MEEKNVMTKDQIQEDYSNVYVKKVHLIGRATMAIAFILMFSPVLYMHFVAGFTAPADAYMACAAAACAEQPEPTCLIWPAMWAIPACLWQWRYRAPLIPTTAVPGGRWQR